MLGRMGIWRHIVAGVSVVFVSLLALIGVTGEGDHVERFDAKFVTVQPVGSDGLRLHEVVDQDFGSHRKHGYERTIPIDFGNVTDVVASSPDANADVDVTSTFDGDRIRLGDPDTTYTGQHRYLLDYTLPNTLRGFGSFNLDIIGTDETMETMRFEVVVMGLDLRDPECDVGSGGTKGGCTLTREGDVYRTVVSPLKPGQGITISGVIVGSLPISDVADPPVPNRRADHRALLGLLSLLVGAAAVIVVFLVARRAGRNEVFAGGAADAAYGTLPDPAQADADRAVRFVADSQMDELATIEFVPPKGIEPWQGAVLLNERIDRDTVAAWMSGLVAHDAITLTKTDDDLVMRRGSKADQMDGEARGVIEQMLGGDDELTLGKYNSGFSKAWQTIQQLERDQIAASGWWKRLRPAGAGASAWVIVVVLAFFFFGAGSLITALLGMFSGPVSALGFALIVPAVVAYFVYKALLSVRSATGSALALRTESFRRFLDKSEGQHVEWAWKQGLLREYSAWAVALGAAKAWERALQASNVPDPDHTLTSPLYVWSMGSSFASTHTAPSSSGSSGSSFGGGFSGGVGGGGGGGSSGSW